MGDPFYNQVRNRWNETGADTDGGGVTVTHAAESKGRHSVSGIQCSGDAAALVTIESPAATILWRKRFAAAFTMSETFAPGQIEGAENAAILVKVGAATANSEANMQGFTRP